MKDVRIMSGPFDPSVLTERLAKTTPDAGGIASFLGKVRKGGWVTALDLSHYEPLTLPGMEQLADEAYERFGLLGLAMVHRVGLLQPGEPIVCVAAAARHRRDAIEAVDFCMDHLKSAAWFWKREMREGQWYWIEPRDQDHADLARW
jgi:molybdopterin synthase catalytic subunit